MVADFRFQMRARRSKQAKIARTKWWKLKGEMAKVFRVNLWAESKLGLKQKIKKACKSAPA